MTGITGERAPAPHVTLLSHMMEISMAKQQPNPSGPEALSDETLDRAQGAGPSGTGKTLTPALLGKRSGGTDVAMEELTLAAEGLKLED